jgi:hypothetical protein
MNHKQFPTLGIVLVLVILLATACASLATPKNLTFTFSTDEKCTMKGPKTIPAGVNSIDMVGNIQGHGKIGLAILTLNEGKTFKDLQDWTSTDQPSWTTLIDFLEVPSDNSLYTKTFTVDKGPIYFVCFSEIPGTLLNSVGPVEVNP